MSEPYPSLFFRDLSGQNFNFLFKNWNFPFWISKYFHNLKKIEKFRKFPKKLIKWAFPTWLCASKVQPQELMKFLMDTALVVISKILICIILWAMYAFLTPVFFQLEITLFLQKLSLSCKNLVDFQPRMVFVVISGKLRFC